MNTAGLAMISLLYLLNLKSLSSPIMNIGKPGKGDGKYRKLDGLWSRDRRKWHHSIKRI